MGFENPDLHGFWILGLCRGSLRSSEALSLDAKRFYRALFGFVGFNALGL